MRRIVILGCSGSGKSTLARRIGERLGLPVVHLDALFWEPGWVESELSVFRARVTEALAVDGWVCDGGYSRTYDLRFPYADTVIWLQRPRWLCLWRVIKRGMSQLGHTRIDMAPGCPEQIPNLKFLLFVWNWEKNTRPKILAGLAQHAPDTPRIVLSSDAQVDAFVATLASAHPRGGAAPNPKRVAADEVGSSPFRR